MLSRLWCALWGHSRIYMFTNGGSRAVFHCKRCPWVHADKS